MTFLTRTVQLNVIQSIKQNTSLIHVTSSNILLACKNLTSTQSTEFKISKASFNLRQLQFTFCSTYGAAGFRLSHFGVVTCTKSAFTEAVKDNLKCLILSGKIQLCELLKAVQFFQVLITMFLRNLSARENTTLATNLLKDDFKMTSNTTYSSFNPFKKSV